MCAHIVQVDCSGGIVVRFGRLILSPTSLASGNLLKTFSTYSSPSYSFHCRRVFKKKRPFEYLFFINVGEYRTKKQ